MSTETAPSFPELERRVRDMRNEQQSQDLHLDPDPEANAEPIDKAPTEFGP